MSTTGLTGYSILEAADLGAAAQMGEGCPILADGGSVDVYEALAADRGGDRFRRSRSMPSSQRDAGDLRR